MARDITQLHPTLQQKVSKLKEECAKKGIKILFSECLRTKEEQDDLYAQGRSKPGNIVTNAKGSTYSSQHQWGIAIDFYIDQDVDGDGKKTDDAFNNSTKLFDKVGKIAKSIGLGWGGDWTSIKDKPHLYLKDWGSTTSKLKKKYDTPEKFFKTWKKTVAVTSATKKKETSIQKVEEKGSGYMFQPEVVKKGSKGKSVLLLQKLLRAMGYKGKNGKPLELDEECGSNTEYAINAYQTARRKKGVELGTDKKNDSSCGPKMWKDLIKL